MRPIIGITANWNEENNVATVPMTYIDAVLAAGGKPLLIPVMPDDVAEENLSVIDALLIPGGVDIDPRHFNERPSQKLGRVNPRLDALELGLGKSTFAEHADARHMPRMPNDYRSGRREPCSGHPKPGGRRSKAPATSSALVWDSRSGVG